MPTPDRVRAANRAAWDQAVAHGDRWTVPATPDAVAQARAGNPRILLTNTRPAPREWLGDLRGRDVLALAAGGGQQAPLLAAAGATVTVLDNSPAQLAQDRRVAEREGLEMRLEEGDMADLSRFPDESFDLVVNPCSTLFVPDVRAVWRDAHRVLRPGGHLLTGFLNPVTFLLDRELEEKGVLQLRHEAPYSDLESLTADERAAKAARGEPALEWGHSLTDQMGGQLDAGFVLVDLYEDHFGGDNPIDHHMPGLLATRARRV